MKRATILYRWLLSLCEWSVATYISLLMAGFMVGASGLVSGVAFYALVRSCVWCCGEVVPLVRSWVTEWLYRRDRVLSEYVPEPVGNVFVSFLSLSFMWGSLWLFSHVSGSSRPSDLIAGLAVPCAISWSVWPALVAFTEFREFRRDVYAARDEAMEKSFWRMIRDNERGA